MLDATDLKFEEIATGMTASFEVLITDEMVESFAALSGDRNPLHMDHSYATASGFNERVVHGMLGASLFSRLIGMHLPGKRAVYLSQSLLFRAPMRIGMQVLVSGEAVRKTEAVQAIVIHTMVTQKGTQNVLIEGEALAKVLP